MELESRRDLQLLEALEHESTITQRTLASRLGMALGALAGGAVILSPVSFIWVAPVSSLVTILGAQLFRRPALAP